MIFNIMGADQNKFNHMKAKGRTYNFVIQPLLTAVAVAMMFVGLEYLFMWFDYGQYANELFEQAITSGWDLILYLFIGTYFLIAMINVISWEYYKRKWK